MTGPMTAKPPSLETGGFFIKAVLDIGTNSVKLLAAKFENGGTGPGMEILADVAVVSRLGDSAGNGPLTREAMRRTVAVMSELCAEARRLGADDITAVGTQALRTAPNAGEFISMAEVACGVRVTVISGEEEAELSFAAASLFARDNPDREILVFDVGGGSSEVVRGRPGSIICSRSVPVGALSLYKKFFVSDDGTVPYEVLEEAGRYLNGALAASLTRDFDFGNLSSCVGIGGTVTTLAAVCAGGAGRQVGGMTLDTREIDRQIAMYASTDVETRRKIPGLPAERADIILPGACIVRSLMSVSGFGEITVCGHGLRHGVMLRALRQFDFGTTDEPP